MRSVTAIATIILSTACTGLAWDTPLPATDHASAPPADLEVWPADGALEALITDAAARIEAAAGLRVAVGDGLPMFWSSRGEAEGWLGLTHIGGEGDWIVIDESVPASLREAVVLHELLHALGAGHVSRGAGVMSPQLWTRPEGWPLTAADLEALCADGAVRDCSVFAPEAGVP